MDVHKLYEQLSQVAVDVGSKLLGALLLWIVGRWVIAAIKRLIARAMRRSKIEIMLISYAESVTSVLLNIVLALAILGVFGVQTTTFAAMIAAAGLAIGTAWGGLLQNFAAGAFLVVLKPFKPGDYVTIAGVSGTVVEISLFVITLDTPDNVRTIVGNAKVFGDTIQNFSANKCRRVDRTVQLAHGADWGKAIGLLKERLAKIPNVVKEPPPEVAILDFTLAGPVLAVRPYCHNDHYWQVYADTNFAIKEELTNGGFPTPATEQAHQIRSVA